MSAYLFARDRTLFQAYVALHPSEPWAAGLHCGYTDHEIVIVTSGEQPGQPSRKGCAIVVG